MLSEKYRLAANASDGNNCRAKSMRVEAEELQISISVELLQKLLTQKTIKACQVRCLNTETANILKAICMDCCAKNLLSCPVVASSSIDVLQPLESSFAVECSDEPAVEQHRERLPKKR